MSRIRQFLSTAAGTVLLVLLAGPASAGPAPLDEGGGGSVGGAGPSAGSDPSIWMYAGLAVAGLLVIAVVAVTSIALDRHAHQAPQPA